MKHAVLAATLGIFCASVVGLGLLFFTDRIVDNAVASLSLLGVGLVAVSVGLWWARKELKRDRS